ncbi:MAG: response regulator [Candidatus Omnitrophota bacterium]|nr:response regulator [Candidatus Omnitrophota bacterium]
MAKPTILVCDDEPGIRAAIRLVLERDYELVFAGDGEEALELLNNHHADLILLDIKLPKKDGLEVLRELTVRQPVPRVLMLTAYQSVELAQRATQSGALDYVTKPFERQALLNAVERALDLRDWQRPSLS